LGILNLMYELQSGDYIDFINSETDDHIIVGPTGNQAIKIETCPKCKLRGFKNSNGVFIHSMKVIKSQNQVGFEPIQKCEMETITGVK